MFKKIVATGVAAAAVLACGIGLVSPQVQAADQKPTVVTMQLLGIDLKNETEAVFFKIEKNDQDRIVATKTTEDKDWNVGYYPTDYAVLIKNLDVEGQLYKNFLYASLRQQTTAGQVAYPLTVVVQGENSLKLSNDSQSVFYGSSYYIRGQEGKTTDSLKVDYDVYHYAKECVYILNADDTGVEFENISMEIDYSYDISDNDMEVYAIDCAGSYIRASNSDFTFKMDGNGRGMNAIHHANSNNSNVEGITISDTTIDADFDHVANISSVVFSKSDVKVSHSEVKASIDIKQSGADKYTKIYGVASGSSLEVEKESSVDLTIGDISMPASEINAADYQGIIAEDNLTISESQYKAEIGKATNRRTGLEAEYIKVEDSDVSIDFGKDEPCKDSLNIGLFSFRDAMVSGEGNFYIGVPYTEDPSIQCTALRCYNSQGYAGTGGVFSATLTGKSVMTLGDNGMAIDNTLPGAKIYNFNLCDHSELTLFSEGGVDTSDAEVVITVSEEDPPFCFFDGESEETAEEEPSIAAIDWSSKFVHVDSHVYSDCDDTDCNTCGHKRTALTHQFGGDICAFCGFIRKVEISDIDAPKVGAALDTDFSCNIYDEAGCSISWEPSDEKAAYDTEYTVTVILSPNEGLFCKNDDKAKTVVTFNGEEVDYEIDDGNLIVTKTFAKTVSPTPTTAPATATPKPTAKPTEVSKPSATPTALVTATPEPTATTAPATITPKPTYSTEPTITPSVEPTVEPTVAPTEEVTPTITPTETPVEASKRNIMDFVARIYTFVLDREPEEEGAAFWSDELYSFRRTGAEVGLNFIFSDEFTNRGLNDDEFVTVLYKTFFGRDPEEGGFAFWTGALKDGTLDRMQVAYGFVYSQEWADTCARYGIRSGGDIKPSIEIDPTDATYAFVERMYTTAMNRASDEEGAKFWSGELANFRFTGEQVGVLFFLSDEMNSFNLDNSEFVTRLYKTFMDREPEEGGFNFWVKYLEDGGTRESVVLGFTRSEEFVNKCIEARILPY